MARSLNKISLIIRTSTAPQRERSDTPKVTRGLREHMLDLTLRAALRMEKTMFYSGTACLRGLQSTTPATTNEPEASEVLHPTRNHHHVPNHRSNFTKQPKKMISKTASHFDQRFRNAQTCHVDQKNVRCPAPVTHNQVSDFKMSRKSHAC